MCVCVGAPAGVRDFLPLLCQREVGISGERGERREEKLTVVVVAAQTANSCNLSRNCHLRTKSPRARERPAPDHTAVARTVSLCDG